MAGLPPCVVFDIGSFCTRYGPAGYELPRVRPSVISRPAVAAALACGEGGVEPLPVVYSRCVEKGTVVSWDDYELLLSLLLHDLGMASEQHPVLVTEAPLAAREDRERLVETLFESLGAPAASVNIQAVLSLYATGRTTGIVLDVGDGATWSVPIYEGYSLPHATRRLSVAGADVTRFYAGALGLGGAGAEGLALARRVKEALAFVHLPEAAGVGEAECKRSEQASPETLVLPDGTTVRLPRSALTRGPEALFDVSILGDDGGCGGGGRRPRAAAERQFGLPDLVHGCVMSTSDCSAVRDELFRNVVLSGGSTAFRNLPKRLVRGMRALTSAEGGVGQRQRLKALLPEDRDTLAWLGGSVLASLSVFRESIMVKRSEYEEEGVDAVLRRSI